MDKDRLIEIILHINDLSAIIIESDDTDLIPMIKSELKQRGADLVEFLQEDEET